MNDARKLSADIDQLISKSSASDQQVISILVSKIQALRPQAVARPMSNPASNGWYNAIIIGQSTASKCYFADGEWFSNSKPVKVSSWTDGK